MKNIAEEMELVKRHLPLLYMDKKEPFSVIYIGYTVFDHRMSSDSSDRLIDPAEKHAAVCIEYAFYYDYDIQHLYDLEHLWIYLDEAEKVCGCECSFHGMYLNAMLPGTDILHGKNRVHMYVQPGKHAFLPRPELFHLFPDFLEACAQKAGKDGILTPSFIPGMPEHSRKEDRKMERFLRERFSFSPSEEYIACEIKAQLITWEKLKGLIPERIREKMDVEESKL